MIKELADVPYIGFFEFHPAGKTKGHAVCIAYGEFQVFPWAVGYLGNSHFFRTLPEAVAFCAGRRFIESHMSDSWRERIEQAFRTTFGEDPEV